MVSEECTLETLEEGISTDCNALSQQNLQFRDFDCFSATGTVTHTWVSLQMRAVVWEV